MLTVSKRNNRIYNTNIIWRPYWLLLCRWWLMSSTDSYTDSNNEIATANPERNLTHGPVFPAAWGWPRGSRDRHPGTSGPTSAALSYWLWDGSRCCVSVFLGRHVVGPFCMGRAKRDSGVCFSSHVQRRQVTRSRHV